MPNDEVRIMADSETNFVYSPLPWSVSTIESKRDPHNEGLLHVRVVHPNDHESLDGDGGRAREQTRLGRKQATYIYEEMRDAITREKPTGLKGFLFRRSCPERLANLCVEKRCFRRELALAMDKAIEVHPEVCYPASVDKELGAMFTKLASDNLDRLGSNLGKDVLAGCSRPFPSHEMLRSDHDLRVFAASRSTSALDPASMITFAVSYRHKTPKQGLICNLDVPDLVDLINQAAVLSSMMGFSYFRLWTDQILSSRKPDGHLKWVSSGIFPYAIFPVLYYGAEDGLEDSTRLWLSIEHIAASACAGLIPVARQGKSYPILPDWTGTIIEDTSRRMRVFLGLTLNIFASMRKISAVIMLGLSRAKALSWPADRQDLLDWADLVTGGASYRDLEHTFSCEDCLLAAGYTAGHRMSALLSSCQVVDVSNVDCSTNCASPRLSVPSLFLARDGRCWDGFREWVPEAALWGSQREKDIDMRAILRDNTNVCLWCGIGERGVAICNFTWKLPNQQVAACFMAVGLDSLRPDQPYYGHVLWTKRFWSVKPLRTLQIMKNARSRSATAMERAECANILSASTSLHPDDFINARHVVGLVYRRIRWV
jgi:hypothetical protein